MDGTLKNFLESGKALLTDTKTRKPKAVAPKPPKVGFETASELKGENDPHKKFVKRVIDAKPKKSDLVEDLKSFIEKAEAEL